MKDTKLFLAQTNPRLGNRKANLDEHLAQIDAARSRGAEWVLFPELSLTGYFLKDQTSELALASDADELETLRMASSGLVLGFGIVERGLDERFFNSYLLYEDGELAGLHRKVYLVNYGMFEESRDFAAGDRFLPFDVESARVGILTCEDAWHLTGAFLHFVRGVDVLLVPSASPARGLGGPPGSGFESTRTWDTLLRATAMFTQTWVVHVNRVGFEDGIGFAGRTQVIDPFGETVARIEGLDEGTLEFTLTASAVHRARVRTPLRRDERPRIFAEELARAIEEDATY